MFRKVTKNLISSQFNVDTVADFRKMKLLCIQVSDRLPVRKTDIKIIENSYKFQQCEV